MDLIYSNLHIELVETSKAQDESGYLSQILSRQNYLGQVISQQKRKIKEFATSKICGARNVDSNGFMRPGFIPHLPIEILILDFEENLEYLAHMLSLKNSAQPGNGQIFAAHAHGPSNKIYDIFYASDSKILIRKYA